jgi:hypothetical protein
VLCLPAPPLPRARARVRVCLQNMYFSPELNAATEKLIAHAHKNSIILGLFLFGCAASSAVAHNVARADQMEFTHRDRERERERERERSTASIRPSARPAIRWSPAHWFEWVAVLRHVDGVTADRAWWHPACLLCLDWQHRTRRRIPRQGLHLHLHRQRPPPRAYPVGRTHRGAG